MPTKYSLTQLVETANQTLAGEGISSSLNERLVRHYASSKILPAPAKEGRDAVYDENHLNALLSLRRSQAAGITSKGYTNLLTLPEASSVLSTAAEYNCTPSAQDSDLVKESSKTNGTPSRDSALAYLLGISSQASPPNSIFSSLMQGSTQELGSVASAGTSALRSALPAHAPTPPAPLAETWTTWQVAPGVRFEVRSDTGWTQAAEDSLLAIIATIPKTATFNPRK